MTVYGVTPQGFVIKPTSAIVASMTANVLAKVAADTDVAPDQPLGQIITIIALELSAGGWELGQVAYNATNRGDAEGDLLDNIGGLTGTPREAQSPSTAPCTVAFSAAGTYVAGTLAAFIQGQSAQQWVNQFDIVVPDLVGGNPVSPTNQYTAMGIAWASLVDGPVFGQSLIAATRLSGQGQLNQQVPFAGWVSIIDTPGIILGTLEEEDPPYRVRQYEELSAPGSATLDAIEAAILAALATVPVAGAVVEMLENTGLTTDGHGVPGKAFMAVVFDGPDPSGDQILQDDQLIAQAIWDNKPAGMEDYGTHAVTITDSLGIPRTVHFTRPTGVPIYFSLIIAVAAGTTTDEKTAISTAIEQALVNASQGKPFTLYGTTFTPGPTATTTLVPGADAVLNALRSIVQGQSGVLDVPTFLMAKTFPPTGTSNLGFAVDEVGIVLTGNDGTNPYFLFDWATLSP